MAAVLSEDNQELLHVIRDQRPKSLTVMAELTGCQVPNLWRTLRMVEGLRLGGPEEERARNRAGGVGHRVQGDAGVKR
jgi:predicted transcriptional regulator